LAAKRESSYSGRMAHKEPDPAVAFEPQNASAPQPEREEAKRVEAERKTAAEAEKIIEIWNARQAGWRAVLFYPTFGAAIATGLSRRCSPYAPFAKLEMLTAEPPS
jgi:hypothetical protein